MHQDIDAQAALWPLAVVFIHSSDGGEQWGRRMLGILLCPFLTTLMLRPHTLAIVCDHLSIETAGKCGYWALCLFAMTLPRPHAFDQGLCYFPP